MASSRNKAISLERLVDLDPAPPTQSAQQRPSLT